MCLQSQRESILNRLLIWVNEQPTDQADKQAKKLRMHLYTHGIHIASMQRANLHAQWSALETTTLSPQAILILSQFLDSKKTSCPATSSVTPAVSLPRNTPQSSPVSTKQVNEPVKFWVSILVGWMFYDDPPTAPITARILGIAFRPVFGKNLSSLTDDYLQTNRTFTFSGISTEAAGLAETPRSVNTQGWRINWKKSIKQPWSP